MADYTAICLCAANNRSISGGVKIPDRKKKPALIRFLYLIWWRRRESNPRPQILYRQFYILSAAI